MADSDLYLDRLVGALVDVEVLGAVLNGMLKVDAAQAAPTGRGDRRPEPDLAQGKRRLSTIMGDRYQMRPFLEAFAAMTVGQSIRDIADQTGLSRSVVHRLAKGVLDPTTEQLVAIAVAYGRAPEWFVEYRAARLAQVVEDHMRDQPERSATICEKL